MQAAVTNFQAQQLATSQQAAREDQQRSVVMKNMQLMQSKAHDDTLIPVIQKTNFYNSDMG